MKPLLAGSLAAFAILTGWSIDSAIQADPPLVVATDPPSQVTYVTITDPPATTSTSSTTSSTTTTTFVPALLPVDHVCYDWLPMLLEAGWPADPDILATALTIMWRESRCQPDALNERSHDIGLWQINARSWCRPNKYNAHPAGWLGGQGIISNCDDLYDPAINMRSAFAMYKYSEDKNGPGMGWWPWRLTSG